MPNIKEKYNPKTNDDLKELHDVVDKDNKIVGVASRIHFLKNKRLIRRSCHVWLKNSTGKYWLQLRSKKKDLQPLHWNCAASGFVSAHKRTKKEILQEAKRELREELGIQTNIKLIKIFLNRGKQTGGIMVYLFLGFHDGPFKVNPTEVVRVKAFNLEKVTQLYKKNKMQITEPTVKELKILSSIFNHD